VIPTLLWRPTRLLFVCFGLVVLVGCANRQAPFDYGAFQRANPKSLLVMPPVNMSPDIKATPGVWANATRPLAEAGYYVLPITLVDETFKQNGVFSAADANEIPLEKLREQFGADAAVYLKVTRYGTSYNVVSSDTRVEVEAHFVDLRTGEKLWAGRAVASSSEQQNSSGGGLIGLLVTAAVKQIINTSVDAAYNYAVIADGRLLGGPRYNGVPPGPRSPRYGQPPTAR
jgi:hypothetical protein